MDNSPPPEARFLDLSNRELQEWVALPVTRQFLAHLREQHQWARDASVSAATQGEYPKASADGGAAIAFLSLLMACTQERKPAEDTTQDSTFVHPSARKGRNGIIVG